MVSKNWRQSHAEPDPLTNMSGVWAGSTGFGTAGLHPLLYFSVQILSGVERQLKESTDGIMVNRK